MLRAFSVDDIRVVGVVIVIPAGRIPNLIYGNSISYIATYNYLLTHLPKNFNPKTLDDRRITGFIVCNIGGNTLTHLENCLAVKKKMHYKWL
jgi:hypothetical protein